MQKPSIPKGTRDFSPIEVARRRYIFNTIEQVFQRYGFMPIETPSMENLSTLTGKYGDEGDTLLFKVLNSGDFAKKAKEQDWNERNSNKLVSQISEKGLRYDLTVPFARYVVMNQTHITFPFRRYQMQPVWRADRPQKGRYREFYQCDADIIGSDSLLNEADLVMIYAEAFEQLGINVTIKINNRKVLMGIAQAIGVEDKLTPLTVAIDKLDKIGVEGVEKELLERDFTAEQAKKAIEIISFEGDNAAALAYLKTTLETSEDGKKGIEELETVWKYLQAANFDFSKLKLDLTLARGLNYYTGAIFEVTANDTPMGSIGGGGRYDDLTGIFGLKGVSGVGISFGADRIYDVMDALNLFPQQNGNFTQLLFCCMTSEGIDYAVPLAVKARQAGINTEIYPTNAKLKKQLDFANKNQIPFAIIIGESEIESGQLTLKNLNSGEQGSYTIDEALKLIVEN